MSPHCLASGSFQVYSASAGRWYPAEVGQVEGQGGGQDWGHTTGPRVTHSTAWCPNKNRDLTNKHGNLKKKYGV